MTDAESLADILRIGDSIHPDHLTDEALTCLTETLARYARKHLPEGYVLRLDCSAHASAISLIKGSDEIQDGVQLKDCPEHWGRACDYAQEGQQ
ncbi:MAG: hypothetical protein ACK528_13510 [Alphaproteobacteria bacterium]|jgi:hypothetical protein